MEQHYSNVKIILSQIIYSSSLKEELKSMAAELNDKIESIVTLKPLRFSFFSAELNDDLFHSDGIHLQNRGLRIIRGSICFN